MLRHILITAVGTLLCTFKNDLLYAYGDLRYEFLGRGHLLLDLFDGDGHGGVPVKGNSAGEHLKKGNTQRIDITLFIGKTASCLFRRGIMNASHYIAGNRI